MYHNPLLAFTLGITLVCTVILAKTIGCTLPLIAKKCGLDPALMAAPLITTLVDTGTILIYFTIVTRIFHL
jgi:magnesium transporter